MGTKIGKIATVLVLVLFSLFSFSGQSDAASSTYITKGNTSSKVVALTFDDGSDGTNINKILSILSTHNVKATFFLTGSGAEDHPQDIKNIAAKGHQLGNHSYSHPDFRTLTAAQMKSQLDRTETIIKNLTGKTTKPIFRAPFGSVNADVLSGVGAAGYGYTIQWNIDTIDWRGYSATTITNKVVNNIVPGSIVLMHTGAGAPGTPIALPNIITQLKAKGYSFVTVSQLLNLPSSGSTTYTVKAGDTLYGIAQRFNTTVAKIAAANNITNVNYLRIGQVLIIPGTSTAPTPPPATSTTYTVKAGDTLYAIAQRFNTTVAKIAAANNITNVNLLRIGQVLIIPGTSTAPPPATTIKYTVKAGDTLYAIALRYNTTVAKIAAANNITNVNFLRIGQVLIIPQ
ncbi:LysM peptidoglycan-binding domain-containing protein [Planococcus salinarum]|uniref:LysM peptidoglycan-binding domain-containing protein n=1 Tax=Planococcus salinarum TaxID=622695 RepID=UPI000E3D8B2A|nr:LysM peptidoglycan-binding domain-containing protein [Planococcus salinarum]TAA66479.1 LysM peptidoglycan-binding domain-containing protein [Planococcus salinarum]